MSLGSELVELEPSRRTRVGTRLPIGLLGMLLLVCLVESFFARAEEHFLGALEYDWRVEGRAVRRFSPPAQILCFGDCMVKFAVTPRVVEERLKRKAYSLALLDGKPPASYFMLRRALAAGARPQAVVVDFEPACLHETEASVAGKNQWACLLNLREALELACSFRDSALFARVMLGHTFASIRGRDVIRNSVVAAVDDQKLEVADTNQSNKRNLRVNRGGILLPPKPEYHGEVPPASVRNGLFQDEWVGKRQNALFLDRFFRLAAQNQIAVFWLLAPNAPAVLEHRQQSGQHARYERFVNAVLARYGNVFVLDARGSRYPHNVFVDPVHIDRVGASVLSADVADAIQARLAAPEGPRWVALPAYREQPADVVLEDTARSAKILRAEREAANNHSLSLRERVGVRER